MIFLQVLEARGLSLPHEQMPSLFGANLFALATVTGESSSISARTEMQQGTMSPKWNQELVFPDVTLTHSLTVTVFAHRRLTADSAVGQVSLSYSPGWLQYDSITLHSNTF